jgi:L,D-transpeptidase YcbB
MTKSKFFFILFCAMFLSIDVRADTSPHAEDLQTALTQPTVTVDEYELDGEGLRAFYAAHDNHLAWNFTGVESATTFTAFLESLERLIDYHGLQPEDYPLEAMRKLGAGDGGVKLELLVTDSLLKLAHDLHGDNVDLDQLYPGWNFHRNDENIPGDLAAAVTSNQLAEYIGGLAPKNPAYAQLAQILGVYRGFSAKGKWSVIDAGPALRPKDRGARVVQLRARLAAEDYASAGKSLVFDETLHKALMDWQRHHGLDADGHVGKNTLEALNVPVQTRIDQVRANMERWRHMPEDFPPQRYALVNIATATIKIVEDGKAVYQGPVVVGRVDRKTPFIQSAIRSMIVNPSWHVPKKIAQQDILPKLRKDPHYLEKLGFVIKGNEDDPHGENIDWKSMSEQEFDFRLRQSPGDRNSLGRLKFDFDNDFAVYMHGTPHQELFKKDIRNFSSGCVRLRDPEQVAEVLLAGNKDPWTVDRIEEEINTDKTRWVAFAKPIPLYILYWTVFMDEDGKTNFREDVYDYDGFLIENLKGDEKIDKAL